MALKTSISNNFHSLFHKFSTAIKFILFHAFSFGHCIFIAVVTQIEVTNPEIKPIKITWKPMGKKTSYGIVVACCRGERVERVIELK